jgi:hypothetical protein
MRSYPNEGKDQKGRIECAVVRLYKLNSVLDAVALSELTHICVVEMAHYFYTV